MKELKEFENVKLFGSGFDEATLEQLTMIANLPQTQGLKISLMPDGHKGVNVPIGFTMEAKEDAIIPSLVSSDIGCGVIKIELPKYIKKEDINFKSLNEYLERSVPTGYHLRNTKSKLKSVDDISAKEAIASVRAPINQDKALRGIGTLGDGNHYIEVNTDEEGILFITVHTGSRSLGGQIGNHYEKLAASKVDDKKVEEWHKQMLAQPKKQRHQWMLDNQNPRPKKKPIHQELTGQDMEDYLHDLKIGQLAADLNRKEIAFGLYKHILWQLGKVDEYKEPEYKITIHNYFNFEDRIIRKGAISAKEGEEVIIPINMRDGSIIAIGKGNADANFSAPHGAGRLGSRTWAKSFITLDDLKESMKGIESGSLNESTIDEAPMAYKSIEYILEAIEPLATVVKVIKPVFNFKHSEIR